MIRLRDILKEDIVSVTFNDIWNGVTINHGDSMAGEKSTLKTIQRNLQSKHPKYAKEIKFKPDNDFGDKTSKMIGKLFGTTYTDLSSVKIGPAVLIKLGYKKPVQLDRKTEIIAATLTLEGASKGEREMRAIANVLKNRSNLYDITVQDAALKPGHFSMWNGVTNYYPTKTDPTTVTGVIEKAKTNPDFRSMWPTAVSLSKNINTLKDITGGATHYYIGKQPPWANPLKGWVVHKDLNLSHTYGSFKDK